MARQGRGQWPVVALNGVVAGTVLVLVAVLALVVRPPAPPGVSAFAPHVAFVNSRFQLYGRKIRIVPFPSKQADQQAQGTLNDPTSQRADAAQVTQLKVFASTDFVDPLQYSWSLPEFRSVLTKNKILS